MCSAASLQRILTLILSSILIFCFWLLHDARRSTVADSEATLANSAADDLALVGLLLRNNVSRHEIAAIRVAFFEFSRWQRHRC